MKIIMIILTYNVAIHTYTLNKTYDFCHFKIIKKIKRTNAILMLWHLSNDISVLPMSFSDIHNLNCQSNLEWFNAGGSAIPSVRQTHFGGSWV